MVKEGENAGNQHFFPQCFQKVSFPESSRTKNFLGTVYRKNECKESDLYKFFFFFFF